MRTEPCAVCGNPVDLAELHVMVDRHVERLHAGVVEVLDAEVISIMHLDCGQRMAATAEAVTAVT